MHVLGLHASPLRRVILGAALAAWAAVVNPVAPAAEVQIGELRDLSLGTWPGSGDLEAEGRHCVLGGPAGRYAVRLTGTGPGGAFSLSNQIHELAYQVFYNDGSGYEEARAGATLTGQRGSPNNNQFNRCRSGGMSPQRIRVTIRESDLSRASAGLYTGALSVLVMPE